MTYQLSTNEKTSTKKLVQGKVSDDNFIRHYLLMLYAEPFFRRAVFVYLDARPIPGANDVIVKALRNISTGNLDGITNTIVTEAIVEKQESARPFQWLGWAIPSMVSVILGYVYYLAKLPQTVPVAFAIGIALLIFVYLSSRSKWVMTVFAGTPYVAATTVLLIGLSMFGSPADMPAGPATSEETTALRALVKDKIFCDVCPGMAGEPTAAAYGDNVRNVLAGEEGSTLSVETKMATVYALATEYYFNFPESNRAEARDRLQIFLEYAADTHGVLRYEQLFANAVRYIPQLYDMLKAGWPAGEQTYQGLIRDNLFNLSSKAGALKEKVCVVITYVGQNDLRGLRTSIAMIGTYESIIQPVDAIGEAVRKNTLSQRWEILNNVNNGEIQCQQ